MGLPNAITQLADSILRGEDGDSARLGLKRYLSEQMGWLDRESDYFLSDEDASAISRARALAAELVKIADLRTLTPEECSRRVIEVAALLVSFLERVRLARAQSYFLKVPALDQLAVVAIAVLSKRGQVEAVDRRLAAAREAVAELGLELERVGAQIQDSRQPILDALKTLSESLALVETWTTTRDGSLKTAIRAILDAGRQVETLHVACQKRDTIHTGMPAADEVLGRLARASAVGDAQAWQQALQAYLGQGEEIVLQAWQAARERLLLPARFMRAAQNAVESALAELHAAAEAGQRKKVWRAAKAVEAARRKNDLRALAIESAVGTILEAPVQALAGAVRGEVPDILLLEVARAFADPQAPAGSQRVRELIRRYLVERDPLRLLEGLELLLEVVDEMNRPGYALKGLMCRCCGQSYRFGAELDFCVQPGRAHTFLDLCA